MTGPIDLSLVVVEMAFWLTLEAGVYTATIRKRVVAPFVAAWAFGHLGLSYLSPGENLLVPYLVVVEFALVLTVLTSGVVFPDERSG